MSRFPFAAAAAVVAAAAVSTLARAETVQIDAAKMAFSPAAVSVHVGDTIEWLNKDFVAHTATGRNHEWDIVLPVHGTGSTVVKAPGKIEYYCRFHPNMKGTITVAAP